MCRLAMQINILPETIPNFGTQFSKAVKYLYLYTHIRAMFDFSIRKRQFNFVEYAEPEHGFNPKVPRGWYLLLSTTRVRLRWYIKYTSLVVTVEGGRVSLAQIEDWIRWMGHQWLYKDVMECGGSIRPADWRCFGRDRISKDRCEPLTRNFPITYNISFENIYGTLSMSQGR